jgi:excisionase family DNA binding protein
MTDTDLLTITEAAALLRTPVATLRWWRHQGTGPASFRIGRRVFYRRRDLEAWIAAQHERDNRGGPVPPETPSRAHVRCRPHTVARGISQHWETACPASRSAPATAG